MRLKNLPALSLLLMLSACKVYYMTPSSLKEQLQKIDPNKVEDSYDFRLGLLGVALKGGQKNFYNGIEKVQVADKSGNLFDRPVMPHTAVRLTDLNGRRTTLYFDSLFLKDSLLFGSKSHFISLTVKPIRIDSLIKIELQ
ncbi:hypothetical protein [Spirosoma linguale]|uniref:Lipoprotein n=1 Tax=Spirosoma linguale (strain ATCC 33905 / DSM 74 / LMG 10896 / Claus 1) TaxID=504472 RepID=D2QN65_SPILD|nr:hypothetical protein Slin_3243 [Spirosoma linguale DSM 74]